MFRILTLTAALLGAEAAADPCGMVPPVHFGGGRGQLQRSGPQRTYVSFRGGLETMALRPGFTGDVDEFGMLIPFPSPPAVRKIADETFAAIEAAVDPPRIVVQVYDQPLPIPNMANAGVTVMRASAEGEDGLRYGEVSVLREEAVGMYQVAVLEAGSAEALKRWMGENGYRYPEGMEAVTEEYIALRWCFVAVKAAVGQGPGVAPSPGMRSTQFERPPGSQFEGYVQGMAFRFETEEPVVPMRLSVFNGADPRNVVYVLADDPVTIRGVNTALVSRQIDGEQLRGNLTEPLPVTWQGGSLADLSPEFRERLDALRDPAPYSGAARDLFAADLLAARTHQLSLPHEEVEKALLNISEALGLRGEAADAMQAEAVAAERQRAVDGALDDLREMHLTVVDGIFPSALLADENLHFASYTMAADRNLRREDAIRAPDRWLSYYKNGDWGSF